MNKLGRVFLVLLGCLLANTASGQFNGHNTLGDFGLSAGSQPAPGWWISAFYYRYEADDLFDRNGNEILPEVPADLAIDAWAPVIYYVSEAKILGGTYGFQAVIPGSRTQLEVPILGEDAGVGSAIGDLYLQPINLGWNKERTDFIAGIGVSVPTGDYEFLGDSNSGLGMWSFELFGGFTRYIDEAKSWHFATTAFYETHTEKDGTDIRVGDLLTLEGGFGYSFMQGAASVGLAYFAQWKVTDDELGDLEALIPPEVSDFVGRHRVYGIGPEVNVPIPIRNKLVALLNLRYIREFGARTKSQGDALAFTITFPVPSIPLE